MNIQRLETEQASSTRFSQQLNRLWRRFFHPEEQEEQEELDCRVYETALNVLGLSKEEAEDSDILEQRYERLCEEWQNRIVRTRHSEPLTKRFTFLLNRTKIAYQTVKNHV